MDKVLINHRRRDEFDEDIYSEGYLEEADEISDDEKWFMIGYIKAKDEE